jgi:hypothetical protein
MCLVLRFTIQDITYYFMHTGNTTKLGFVSQIIKHVNGSRRACRVNER